MACKYVFLESAKAEIEETAAYLLAETGSGKAAANFIGVIQRAIDITCEFPAMHAVSRLPELAELGYRTIFAGNYVLLYTFEEDTIYIAHVFHQRQDYARLV